VTAKLASIRYEDEQLDFRRAAAVTRALWVLANALLQRAAPWSAGGDRAAVITRVTLNLVRLSSRRTASFRHQVALCSAHSTITLKSRTGLGILLMAAAALPLRRSAG
jgi:methionyl-tRNA synthetase